MIVYSDILNNLDPKFICSSESTVSKNELELLVNQLSSSCHGFEFLSRNGFIDTRFEEAWKVLEGSGTESVVDVNQSQVVNYSLKDSLEVESSLANDALIPIDQNDDQLQFVLNRLIRVFANFSSVNEALKYPLSQITDGLPITPRTLSDFIDRTIMLDSSTKLSSLCRPDETLVFGLKYEKLIVFINTFRFLSAMISSLNIFLLLESRFGIRNMLKSAQLRCSIDAEGRYSGKFMIDEGVIERNRLLVKCSVLGGPTERRLPPQCLCEHNADPYPYPIITSLSIESFEPFINKSKPFCNQTPCIDSRPVISKRPITATFAYIVLNILKASNGPRVKADLDILNKLPNIKSKINALAKHLSKSNRQILGIGCLFDICLRANRGINQPISSSVQSNSASSILQPWEEVAITLIIEYGRRVKALDPTVSEITQKIELADMLLYIKTLSSSSSSNKPRGTNSENNDLEGTNRESEIFQTFDWFAALIFLIFNGDRSRASEFLRGFKETELANFLWNSAVLIL
ncbi:unnamed protein product [Rodentolepis nana]|uniref:BROMI C-terminal Rab TBC-like domain-containing protein n=1 Tax=Rodentolepis nana TaxID=102285 RepID=A0A3P7SW37_RODNA|nr:unnamed protein product [Rodentolepis nana]